jgi:gliding motility-associated-like protein
VGTKPPIPVIKPDKPAYCLNDTVKLSTGTFPSATYLWTGPNGFRSDSSVAVIPLVSETLAGTYNLAITYNVCSSDIASITIAVPLPSPKAAFETTPSFPKAEYGPLEVQFKNLSLNAESYLWDFGDGSNSTELNPNHTYTNKGEYSVKLTAFRSNSCSSSVSKAKLAVVLKDSYIFISNLFSPNGDGVNDEFKVVITNIKSYHILIFNRWGQALFESNDINVNWDGHFKGEPVPYGAYYYKINAVGNNNKPIIQSGSITLVR